MMRRLPFPMAINTAFEMCQGKMTLKDYGSAAQKWKGFQWGRGGRRVNQICIIIYTRTLLSGCLFIAP